MTAVAASKAAADRAVSRQATCKPRANCLKLKEIAKRASRACGVLTCGALNYLKVKIGPSQVGSTAGMIAS